MAGVRIEIGTPPAEVLALVRAAIPRAKERREFDGIVAGLENLPSAVIRIGEVFGVFVEAPRHRDRAGRPACGAAAAGAVLVDHPFGADCPACLLVDAAIMMIRN